MTEPHPAPARIAVVVGGGHDLGLAAARTLRQRGWTVIAADTERTIGMVEADLAFEAMDVRQSASVDAAATRISARHGMIDALVNAGGGPKDQQALSGITDSAWHAAIDSQLGGALRCCRAFRPLLRDGSAVVNVSSIVARKGRDRTGSHAAATAGLESLTRTVAVEWAPARIRVNALVPGWIGVQPDRGAEAGGLIRNIPLGRFGDPDEFGGAVAFLVSPDAGYITGQCIAVDGGAGINGDW